MSLAKTVDGLLAYVEAHCRTPDYGNRLPEFNALDMAVYIEARRLGLQDADLPRRDVTFHSDEVVFFGRTNVPGVWSSPPDAPSTLTLMPTQGWKADMLALRALAEVGVPPTPGTSEQTAEPVVTPSVEPAGQPTNLEQHIERVAQAVGDDNTVRILAIAKRKHWSGERRMEEILRLDKRFAAKNAGEWAALLGVTSAAVRGYSLWKRLQAAKKADH